jgi:DNA repair protein RecN (Recombination protein N)
MLRHLSIKDFAVVRATELEFGPGMTVVSGETGAGKSLMVDALGFLSGLRADSGVVRHGAARAELSAEFALDQLQAARQWLADNELDDEEQCQLRRVIRADGGSRAWINGRPVTLAQLADLASLLVEIHGQHEQQALLTRPSQLALLDAYAATRTNAARCAAPPPPGRHWSMNRWRCRNRATSVTGSASWSTSCANWTARTWNRSRLPRSAPATAARPMPAPC